MITLSEAIEVGTAILVCVLFGVGSLVALHYIRESWLWLKRTVNRSLLHR